MICLNRLSGYEGAYLKQNSAMLSNDKTDCQDLIAKSEVRWSESGRIPLRVEKSTIVKA